ncbi:ion transporter [Acetanaerobacterium elongatum]|nr:ion transporter [Acetanaerobacterium elongatum]
MFERIKYNVYNLIRDDDENNLAGNIFDSIIVGLIIINIIQVVLDTFKLPPYAVMISNIIEVVSVIVFTIEYLLRLWVATYMYPNMSHFKARIKYALSFMALVDLVAILPFYIPFIIPIDLRVLRALRVIRLFRLLKINRYTDSLHAISDVFRRKASQLLSSILVVFILMLIASVLMFNIENAAQPDKFDNIFDAFWWAIATFTTVGYGDIYPVTPAGKLLSSVIAFLGIGLVAVPTGIISSGFVENIENKKDRSEEEQKYCPYCGKQLK